MIALFIVQLASAFVAQNQKASLGTFQLNTGIECDLMLYVVNVRGAVLPIIQPTFRGAKSLTQPALVVVNLSDRKYKPSDATERFTEIHIELWMGTSWSARTGVTVGPDRRRTSGMNKANGSIRRGSEKNYFRFLYPPIGVPQQVRLRIEGGGEYLLNLRNR